MLDSPLIGWTELWAQAGPWLMVVFRVLGLLVFTPLLSSVSIPRRFRVLLGVMFGTAMYGMIDTARTPVEVTDVFGLAAVMLAELLVGVTLGFMASLPVVATGMAGRIMSFQIGFTVAQSFNPELETEADAFGQLLFFMGMSGFILAGGADEVFILLAETFRRVPIGGLVVGGPDGQIPLEMITALLAAGTELAVRLAVPVVGAGMITLVALGVMMRVMPQLNVITVGFSMMIVVGIGIFAGSLFVVHRSLMDEIMHALEAAASWVVGLGEPLSSDAAATSIAPPAAPPAGAGGPGPQGPSAAGGLSGG